MYDMETESSVLQQAKNVWCTQLHIYTKNAGNELCPLFYVCHCTQHICSSAVQIYLNCRYISTWQTFMFGTKMNNSYYGDINVHRSSVILDKYNLWALPFETKSVTDTQQWKGRPKIIFNKNILILTMSEHHYIPSVELQYRFYSCPVLQYNNLFDYWLSEWSAFPP